MRDGRGGGIDSIEPRVLEDDRPVGLARPLRHRRGLLAGSVAALLVAVGIAVVSGEDDDGEGRARQPVTEESVRVSGLSWASGASGGGVAGGSYADWRGRPLDIAATWADDNDAMVKLWQLQPGGEYGDWQGSLDISLGGISEDESWEEAAQGAYDDRWRESLTNLLEVWGDRPGEVYIRFAHEMNGNWFPWAVTAENHQAFIEAWKRFRALQQETFPDSSLVFCLNRESLSSGIDWRETFPGAEHVDVMSVDYYNQFPYVETEEQWQRSLDATDSKGAPKGLQGHLDFARSVGLPLAVSEWSGNADNGDSPLFIEKMHEFFAANAGDGAGQVLYEIQFNVDLDGGRWHLYPDTRMPESAEAYRRLW